VAFARDSSEQRSGSGEGRAKATAWCVGTRAATVTASTFALKVPAVTVAGRVRDAPAFEGPARHSLHSSRSSYVQMFRCSDVQMSTSRRSAVHMFICPHLHMSICPHMQMFICPDARMFVCSAVHMVRCRDVQMLTSPDVRAAISTLSPFSVSAALHGACGRTLGRSPQPASDNSISRRVP
jgi:hypothetical protein